MDRIDPIQGFCGGIRNEGDGITPPLGLQSKNEFLSQKLTQFQAAFTL